MTGRGKGTTEDGAGGIPRHRARRGLRLPLHENDREALSTLPGAATLPVIFPRHLLERLAGSGLGCFVRVPDQQEKDDPH